MSAAGYDGSIKFDTSVSTKSFNVGITRISTSMKGLMSAISTGFGKAVASIGAVVGAVASVAAAIVVIITALATAGLAVFAWAQKFTNTLYKTLSVTSAYRGQVMELKTAFDTLKGTMMSLGTTLLTAIAPAIMTVINWLVKAINYVSMFIAALTGQKTVMQYVSGSADGAANSTGKAAKNADKLAKNTDKAGKAAKGALAGFDAINVLQKETAENSDIQEVKDTSSGGGSGSGGNMVMKAVEIDSKILEIAGKIRKFFSEIDTTARQLSAIVGYYLTIVWEWVKQAAIDSWNWIKQAAFDTVNWIKQAWADVGQFFSNLWASIKQWASDTWNSIVRAWNGAGAWFSNNVIEPLKKFFTTAWEIIKTKASEAWTKISGVWLVVKTWFTEHVTNPLKEAFGTALDSIKTKFETIFNGVRDFVKGVINKIIDLINGMLSGFTTGINSIIGSLNSVGLKLPGWKVIQTVTAPQIPRLATGAVIPPNSQFLAVLGDQRHGTNIEAPADLIRQIVREEVGGNGGSDFTVNMPVYLDSEKIYEGQKRVTRRRGMSLIAGA